jgi:hypothetical protein
MSLLSALLLGAAAAAQPDPAARPPDSIPAAGVDGAPRRGTYVEAALGLFTAMGGSRAFSSAQPYLGMTLGRDLGERISLSGSLGVTAASASCYQPAPGGGDCLGADSFSAIFLEMGLSYGVPLWPRTRLSLQALGGYTLLSPAPIQRQGAVPDQLGAFHAGAGVSFDYYTHLDHFALGLDAVFRETFARPDLRIPSLAVMPRIRYVF